jgi:deoxyribose-phosphate aldolase
MTAEQLAGMLDHTMVRATATKSDIDKLCDEALEHGFASVAINPIWTSYCAKKLAGSKTRVDPAVGFPLGANTSLVKIEEAREAVKNGADEIDVVINIGALKSGYSEYVERELTDLVNAVPNTPVKVIIEAGYLSTEEKISACEISMRAGAAFVKTATGFGPGGATVDDVALMRRVVGAAMGVKAAGGIRTYEQVLALIDAGASRIGTSASVAIVKSVIGSR